LGTTQFIAIQYNTMFSTLIKLQYDPQNQLFACI
jgi:hypothetical protein